MQPRWISFYMLFYKELRRFNKVIVQTVVTPLITSSLYLLIFGVSLGEKINMGEGIPYLAFIIPGLVMMGVLNNSYQNTSSTIVGGKFTGDIQDLKVTPLSDSQIIWAISLAGLLRGLMVGVVTFMVGQLFYYFTQGEWIAIQNPLLVLVFAAIGGLSFAMMGMSVAIWAKTFEQVSAVGSFLITPLIYLGGVFFSLNALHPFWQNLSKFNPLLYFINGLRYGTLGSSDIGWLPCLGISLVTLVLFYLWAYRSVRKSSFLKW